MMSETVVTIDPNKNTQPKPAGAGMQQTPTSTTPGSGRSLGWLKCNISYFGTLAGICKLVQLILGILCMALASPAAHGATHWFLFVVVIAFISTILWSFIYLLGIREGLNLAFNWILTEFLNVCIITIGYIIAFIVQLAVWSNVWVYVGNTRGVNIAAGVFGLFNTLAYAASSYLLYLEYKTGTVQ